MKLRLAAIVLVSAILAACETPAERISVAEYCADIGNAEDNICEMKFELDGQSRRLSDTELTVSSARRLAQTAMGRADSAMARAEAVERNLLANKDELSCKTVIFNQSKTGSCDAGYKLTSCHQTRFTHRAGGLSILREINDQQCRFHDRVLEMQLRCCEVGAGELTSTVVDTQG